MHIELLEITDSGLAYMVLGGFVVAFSMVSLLVKEKFYVNEVVLGTAIGVLFGPYCANVFNPRAWGGDPNTITLEVMRITLAVGLFAIGVELPQSYLAEHAWGLLIMVVPTMAFGWLVVAGIVYGLFPPLNFISSLVIAACLTPTDPIISAAIVGGKFATKHVPINLRRILAAESAANDGLAYPFLSISIYLTIEESRRVAIEKWLLVGWLYQVFMGTIIGAVLGVAFSKFMRFSHRKGYIDRESYVAQYLALALFTIGVTRTLGSDDLLAAFAAGSAISWDGYFNTQTEDEVFSSVIDLVLNCATFVYIGAWMPFNMFNTIDLGITPWRLVVSFIAILALRRIPPLLLLYKWVPEIASWREALFSGHFGPMGVGAIFISTLAVTELPKPQSPPQGQAELLAATLQTIVGFVVLGSIIIHGLSIPFFSFGRNVRSRTVSLSRTWTSRSRNTNTPDWLLWVRRTPGEVTRPGTPTHDVEQGEAGSKGLIEQRVVTHDDARRKDKEEVYIQELGPAAMIDPNSARTGASEHMHRDADKHATPPPQEQASQVCLNDDSSHDHATESGPSSVNEKDKAAKPETDVKLKPALSRHNVAASAIANVGNTRASPPLTPSPSLSQPDSGVRSRNGERMRIAADAGGGERDDLPPSGAQTPVSQRVPRFPAAEDVREYFNTGTATAQSSGEQAPTSAKTVHFPVDVFAHVLGSREGLGSGNRSDEDATEGVIDAAEGGGGAALGKNVHFPAAQ